MMDLNKKTFILERLVESIKLIQSDLKGNENMDDSMYSIITDFVRRILEILIRDSLPKEYELVLEKINLIEKSGSDNYSKVVNICGELINLGKKIIEQY